MSFDRRVVLLALTLAVTGFSLAVATSDPANRGMFDIEQRTAGVTSNLNFANPFFPGTIDRDLGDAQANSSLVRFCNAKGEIPPYRFTDGDLINGIGGFLTTNSNSSLVLAPGGLFSTVRSKGTFGPLAAGIGNPLRFTVSVTVGSSYDSNGKLVGAVKVEPFRLNIVSTSVYRFAVGPSLSDAIQFQSYTDRLDVLNGNGPYSYSVLPNSVVANGVDKSRLEDCGLSLSKDGTVFGQPLVFGTISFTAVCTDAKGNVALSRDGKQVNQPVTITVDTNDLVTSSSLCMGLSLRGGKPGSDALSYSGMINLGGNSLSSLSGTPLVLRIGNYVSPTLIFDGKGHATGTDAQSSTGKKPRTGKATVTSKGLIKFSTSSDDLSSLGAQSSLPSTLSSRDAVNNNPRKNMGAGFFFANQNTAQVLPVSSHFANSGKFSSSFKLGQKGTLPAGGFLTLSTVSGKDDKKGAGDAWKVNFLCIPPETVTSFSGVNAARVVIGGAAAIPGSVASTATTITGGKLNSKTTARNHITSLQLTLKDKGSYQTTFIDSSLSGIPTSVKTNKSTTTYFTEIDLFSGTSTVFRGANSITLNKKGSGWVGP